jgi:arylsulfatase
VSGDVGLSLSQKVELVLDKREGCRKQAQAQGLGLLERIQFVRKCME